MIEGSDSEGFPVIGCDLFNVEDVKLISFLQEVVKSGI